MKGANVDTVVMPTAQESVCCCEVEKIILRLQESGDKVKCITEHQGFEPVCLNVWVLQVAYFQYRQHYGTSNVPKTDNE